jgi:hypothetical protein
VLGLLGVAWGAASGCSSNGNGPQPPSSPDAGRDSGRLDASDASDGSADSNAACGTAVTEAGTDAIAPVNGGSLIFTDENSTGGGQGEFRASFYLAGQLIVQPTCETTSVGPCIVATNCGPYGPELSCTLPSAGVLSLGGGAFAGDSLAPNSNGTYAGLDYSDVGSVFASGEPFTVMASGGTVPAFQASVTAPGCLGLASPATSDGGVSYTIATAQDLQLVWTGGEPNALVGVTLSGQGGGRILDVSCSFPAIAGQGTVPRQALASLAGADQGYFAIYQGRTSSFDAGSYQIQLLASTFGNGPSADGGECTRNNAGVTYR